MALQTLTPAEGNAWITKHQQDIQKMLDAGGKLEYSQQSIGEMPQYGSPPQTTPTHKGFVNLDPVTGKPIMLPHTPSGGAAVNPTNLGSLLGRPGASTAMALGAAGGAAAGAPGAAGTTPGASTALGPGGQLPPYLLGEAAGVLGSELKGELPADVQNMLAQKAAEYGVASGTQGSQFQGYAGLRNLGLTSLDLSKHAADVLAGQFTKPGEQEALDQSAQKIKDLEDQFNKSLGLEKDKLAQELQLARDKFAQEKNEFERKFQQDQLQSLGLKYGGYGGLTVGGGYGAPAFSEYFTPVPASQQGL